MPRLRWTGTGPRFVDLRPQISGELPSPSRSMVTLHPGDDNHVTDAEWTVMARDLQNEIGAGVVQILTDDVPASATAVLPAPGVVEPLGEETLEPEAPAQPVEPPAQPSESPTPAPTEGETPPADIAPEPEAPAQGST